jgi:hypothetical protein
VLARDSDGRAKFVSAGNLVQLAKHKLAHMLYAKQDIARLKFVFCLHSSFCNVFRKITNMLEIVGNP